MPNGWTLPERTVLLYYVRKRERKWKVDWRKVMKEGGGAGRGERREMGWVEERRERGGEGKWEEGRVGMKEEGKGGTER